MQVLTRTLALAVLLASLCSCSTGRMFAPREARNGSGPTGMQAAVYPLPQPFSGEVRVWCDGGRRATPAGGEERTELLLGFEIENVGATPIRLDPANVRVRAVAVEGGRVEADQATPVPAAVEAAPGSTGALGLCFVVQGGAMPRAIEGFELHWRVDGDGSAAYAQVTPFQTWVPEPASRYYWRDPWPWWGFGFGYAGYYWR